MRLKWLGSAVLVMALAAVCSAQTALTNDAIIKMVKAGLGEDIVLSSIKAQPGNYTTGADDLIALKKAGVTDKIIAAMIAKADSGDTAASPASSAPVSHPPPRRRSSRWASITTRPTLGPIGRPKWLISKPALCSRR